LPDFDIVHALLSQAGTVETFQPETMISITASTGFLC
jgi:hypothetical protein